MSDPTRIDSEPRDPDGPLREGDDPDIAVEPEPDQRRAGFDPLHPTRGDDHPNPFDRGSRSDLA